MAPLQKRAFYALLLGIAWATAIIVVFISQGGASRFEADSGFRLIMDGILVGGLILYWLLFSSMNKRPGKFDERDKIILERSSKFQWMAVILLLVGWVIGLTESFHTEGQVPMIFLYLIFFSTLIVSSLAQSAGILIGYWGMNRNG